MTVAESQTVVQRYIDEVMNGRDRAAVDDLVTSSTFAEQLKGNMDNLEAILSNIRYEVDEQVQEGNVVALFCTLHGKHTGDVDFLPMLSIPATGRDVTMGYAYRFQIEGGKIASMAVVSDLFGALAQMTAEEPAPE